MKQNTQQSGRAIRAKRHKILSFKIKDVKIAGAQKKHRKSHKWRHETSAKTPLNVIKMRAHFTHPI